MVCVTLQAYNRACAETTGGINAILLFDPMDLVFTQTAAGDPYSAVAAATGADDTTNALTFNLNFIYNTADRTFKQTIKGCSVAYEHEVHCQLPQLNNALTDFLTSIDSGGCCCGVGVAVWHNDGKVFILGERIVNSNQIPRWMMVQDGSDGASGKIFQDFNGVNFVLKGAYLREAYEFSGGWSALTAFTAPISG